MGLVKTGAVYHVSILLEMSNFYAARASSTNQKLRPSPGVAVLILLAPIGFVTTLAVEAVGGAVLVGVGPGPGLREITGARQIRQTSWRREKTPL